LPVAAELLTTSVGRSSTSWPPLGDRGVGAASVAGGVTTAARCVTVIEEPAIVSVLVRSAPVLTATVNAAVPLPVPLPVVNVMNDALLVAVQLQLLPAVTVIGAEPVPPSGPNVVVGCTTLNAHDGVVVGDSFLLHADANNDAAIAMTDNRKKCRSHTMPTPPVTMEDT